MAVAAGECGVTLSNSYYVARLLRSTKPAEQEAMRAVGVVWPNQASWGTHVNVSGAGVLKYSPNKAAARNEPRNTPGTRPRWWCRRPTRC